MRIIDADSLIGLVKGSTFLGKGFKHDFISIVNGEPGVEVPEIIIYCKECKHFKRKDGRPYGICDRFGYVFYPDEFCSRAEQREESNESI